MHPPRHYLNHDSHRPQYHYLPPANWMNDPNGLIHWNGAYHLFYQYNPLGAYHHRIHWGHAVSRDLVHWEEWPIALTPTSGDHDQDGCWSGCAVNHNGTPTLFYTGVYPQIVNVATSTDDLLTWQKHPTNPVIPCPPPGIDCDGHFRDPFVWQEPDGWYMLMGTRDAATGGVALLYRSADLVNWEYLQPLLRGDKHQTKPFWIGTIWECPNLVKLGDKYALIVSFQDYEKGQMINTGYFAGQFQDHQFKPSHQGLVDVGPSFYAPQVMTNAQERRLMWGWLREGRSETTQREAGWSGVMSLPRVLSLSDDDTLLMSPAPELAALRGEEFRLDNVTLTPETPNLLSSVRGNSLEILLEVDKESNATLGLKLCCSLDNAEQTSILYDFSQQELTFDASQASLNPELSPELVTAAHPLLASNALTLRIFVDHSVIELFADERTCLTGRIYPTRSDSLGLSLLAKNGSVTIRRLSIWPMNSIWEKNG